MLMAFVLAQSSKQSNYCTDEKITSNTSFLCNFQSLFPELKSMIVAIYAVHVQDDNQNF